MGITPIDLPHFPHVDLTTYPAAAVAGGFASHFGGLAQLTYTHSDDHFGMDNTDLRYANQSKLAGKDWWYGITLNNNPTVLSMFFINAGQEPFHGLPI